MYQVLARRWRPQGFDEVVGQEHITQTLKNAIGSGKLGHAFLFSGPRGVGKTTTARILAKALNCEQGPTVTPCNQCASCREITQGNALDVIEIDGASNNSVDDIRDLREKVKYVPRSGTYKVYIIDEVHMLSGAAFNALLKTLEEPPAHVKFIFATTEPHKIPATILSRCQRYDFRRIPQRLIVENLGEICRKEGVAASPSALLQVARAAEGGMRDAQSILDQLVSSCGQEITEENVQNVLGLVDQKLISDMAEALIRKDAVPLLQLIAKINQKGTNLVHFYGQLLQYLRQLMLVKFCRQPEEILEVTPEELGLFKTQAANVSQPELVLWVKGLLEGEELLRRAVNPRVAMEMSLLKLLELKPMWPVEEVLARLSQLERGIGGTPASTGIQPSYSPRPKPEIVKPATAPISGDKNQIWQQIVSQVIQQKPSLVAMLEHGTLVDISAGEVAIAGLSLFLNDENRKVIESVVQKMGKKLVLNEQTPAQPSRGGNGINHPSRKDSAEARVTPIQRHALHDPVVEKVISKFQGKVLEIKDLRHQPGGELPVKGDVPVEEIEGNETII